MTNLTFKRLSKQFFHSELVVTLQFFALIVAASTLVACDRPPSNSQSTSQLKTITLNDTVKPAIRQTVYVPIYSHIYTVEQSRTIDLTATLSIRNTDLANPMIIAVVDYYDSNGERVRQYLEQPVELGPLASAEFVVNQEDKSGGAGANFIVEWLAQKQITEPVIEAVMIHTLGNQGISFVSQGRVIKSQTTQTK